MVGRHVWTLEQLAKVRTKGRTMAKAKANAKATAARSAAAVDFAGTRSHKLACERKGKGKSKDKSAIAAATSGGTGRHAEM